MKLDKLSLKWKVFSYLLIFAAIILILLWLFQIVFLDSFYKAIKTNTIKKTAHTISENIESNDLQSFIDNMSRDGSTYIRIVSETGVDLYDTSELPRSLLYEGRTDVLMSYFSRAVQNGGSYTEITTGFGGRNNVFPGGGKNMPSGLEPRRAAEPASNIIYAKIVTNAADEKIMILVSSLLSPVNTTVNTLLVQLVCITIIFLVLSLVLAIIISRRISTPIAKINSSAKQLAKGNYDITFEGKGYLEISELNDTLNYAAKELSKVEGLRRELIANISHDLRTPLTMIAGYSEVMRDIPGENTPENVQIIIDETKRLTTLVNDVLDISKLQSGTQTLQFTDFNLTEVVRSTLRRFEKLVEQQGYHLSFVSEKEVYVSADEVKLSQVLYNLIGNALTYTGQDKTVTVVQSVFDGRVKIEVKDTGEGIEKELLPFIWDRYYKIDKSHKRPAAGTGLGLSIVKNVLELHGARYGVISRLGHGSNFWFELQSKENHSADEVL